MSMLSEFTTENYLKVLVKDLAKTGRDSLSTGEIARLMGVTPGTATSMAKKLEKDGYLTYQSHQGCQLTEQGRLFGIRIIRRHRLLELFLAKTLNLDWTEVHDEAENLEHAVSEKLIDCIDAYLEHPDRDPHGDLIPAKFQSQLRTDDCAFSILAEGQRACISRVEGGKTILSYYKDEGLVPGTRLTLLRRSELSGLVTLDLAGRKLTLAMSAMLGIFINIDD